MEKSLRVVENVASVTLVLCGAVLAGFKLGEVMSRK